MYKKIIVATDLGPQSLFIAQHAVDFSKLCQSELHLLHVAEPNMTYTAQFSEHDAQVKKVTERATQSLRKLGQQLNIDEAHQHLEVGNPQEIILQTAQHLQADLIIVGSHGVGGYTHLLGSTAHHLLENARCNVLIVQVTHLEKMIETTMPKDQFVWQQPFLMEGPTQYGSKQGFGEVVKKGPRLSKRPPNSPYRGGTR